MRSDTAFFSAADISRRFLCRLDLGLALCGGGGRFVGGEEERRDAERAARAGRLPGAAPRRSAP